jgi:hypothetical protein
MQIGTYMRDDQTGLHVMLHNQIQSAPGATVSLRSDSAWAVNQMDFLTYFS